MLNIIPSKGVPLPGPKASEGIWGPYLSSPPGVVHLSGETSAGKTVLTYNVTFHLAEGTAFAGFTPPRPLRVLYVDLESPEFLHRRMVETIGRSDNLAFVRTMPHLLSHAQGRKDLKEAIDSWKAEVVVIDPLPVAWPVADENDNAEANIQMMLLKELALETSTLIVTLWNMGEGRVKEKFRSRGATARLDRVDLGLNYDELSVDTRRLKVVKSRFGTRGESIILRFDGNLGFVAVPSGAISIATPYSLIKNGIKALLSTGEHSRKEILDSLKAQGMAPNDNLVDKALGELVQTGEAKRTGRGSYGLPS